MTGLQLVKSLDNSQTQSRQVAKLKPRRQCRKEEIKQQNFEKKARLYRLRTEKTAS